jgi:hypothetical protein
MTSLLREPSRLPAAPGRFPSREFSSPFIRGSRPLAFSRPNPNTFASPYFKDERADLWLERGKPNGASGRRGYKLSCFSLPFFRARGNRLPGASVVPSARANKHRGEQPARPIHRSKRRRGERIQRNLITGCREICSPIDFIGPDQKRLSQRHDAEQERELALKSARSSRSSACHENASTHSCRFFLLVGNLREKNLQVSGCDDRISNSTKSVSSLLRLYASRTRVLA